MRVQLGGLAAAMSVQLWRCPEHQDVLEYHHLRQLLRAESRAADCLRRRKLHPHVFEGARNAKTNEAINRWLQLDGSS